MTPALVVRERSTRSVMESKILLAAILLVGIFGLWGLAQLFIIFWLWFFYDRPIKKIHSQLIDLPEKINKEFLGRGAAIAGIAPHIASRERPLKAKLENLEFNRKLFLDRIQLLFSVKRKL